MSRHTAMPRTWKAHLNKWLRAYLFLTAASVAGVLGPWTRAVADEAVFRADPRVIQRLKTFLVRHDNVQDPQKWRMALTYRVRGYLRPTFLSRRIRLNFEAKVTLEETIHEGRRAYKGITTIPFLKRTVILRKDDLTPLYASIASKDGREFTEFIFLPHQIIVKKTANGEPQEDFIAVDPSGRFYESELLSLVLVSYPFGDAKPRLFDMFFYETLKHYQIKARYMGEEEVQVPYGEYPAHTLRVGPTGFLSHVSKNFVWYQKDPPHLLLKGARRIWWYVDETWELVDVYKERKPGGATSGPSGSSKGGES